MKTSDSIVKILAPGSKVWKALTVPELVKQWQYGSDLLTTWEGFTPVFTDTYKKADQGHEECSCQSA
ncbi:hypothetical protein KV692_14835, partial [Xanthomonas euvesicatoria pv. physalidis]|nr:hypothetical protein [Xanthomonas euvesicatoria pv. physalidis]